MEIILITEPIHPDGMNLLKAKYQVAALDDYTEEEFIKIIPEISGIIVRAKKIQKEVYDLGKKIKIISKHGTGVDNIDIPLATEKGIIVANTPFANSTSVAEFAVASILSLSRKYCLAATVMVQKDANSAKNRLMGTELKGKTIGLFGLGRVGITLAKICRFGFGMNVIGFDPYKKEEDVREIGIELTSDMERVFTSSDFISLHLPLTEKTKNFIGEKELGMMKKSAFLINTSRGGVIDEDALVKSLNSGDIAGAALDVLKKEPPNPDDLILHAKNILTTPHLGGQTEDAMKAMTMTSVQNLLDVMENKRPDAVLNPDVYETDAYKRR